VRFLFLGDVVGKPGRQILESELPGLVEKYKADMVVANGENAAGGIGITPEVMEELFSLGINVLTSGNHIWDKKEIVAAMDGEDRILRPANYPPALPGSGLGFYEGSNGLLVAVINLAGRIFMSPVDCPFRAAEKAVSLACKLTPRIIVDFHAEATSEKMAMGWFLTEKVTAVIGTHTHVQTSDARILPGGTAYISDVGMVGPYNSVIGLAPESIIERFTTGFPSQWKLADGDCILNGLFFEADPHSGRAMEVEQISRIRHI